MYEFLGLTTKMYSVPSSEGKKIEKKPPQPRCPQDALLTSKWNIDYIKKYYFNLKLQGKFKKINCEHHILNAFHQNKVTLSPLDDKKYIFNDMTLNWAHGCYKKINTINVGKRLSVCVSIRSLYISSLVRRRETRRVSKQA